MLGVLGPQGLRAKDDLGAAGEDNNEEGGIH